MKLLEQAGIYVVAVSISSLPLNVDFGGQDMVPGPRSSDADCATNRLSEGKMFFKTGYMSTESVHPFALSLDNVPAWKNILQFDGW